MSVNKYNADLMTHYLYNKLPSIYRTTDNENLLRRFIEVFSEGGLTPLLNDANNIMDLLDVDKCPSQYLPLLCRVYGYEYSLEIPELFQRRLLKYIVDIYKRKGTKSAIKFIARELTGFDSEIIENKDFDEEQIRITKWDKRFEHYRNFILKLTAPYEDSQLYNKEDIVVKIVNQFLPTNSQVFVITAYWFREESEVTKDSIEHLIRDVVRDYNLYDSHKATAKTTSSYTEILKFVEGVEEYAVLGEEVSYLNLGSPPLYTNSVANLRDTIKFATEIYSVVLNHLESEKKDVLVLKEGEFSNALSKYSYTDVKSILKLNPEEFISKPTSSLENSLDKLRLAVEEELFSKSNMNVEDKIKLNILELEKVSPQNSTSETNYDIMRMVEGEIYNQPFAEFMSENSKLNVNSVLLTNGIFIFDTIKEQGKEDTIILL